MFMSPVKCFFGLHAIDGFLRSTLAHLAGRLPCPDALAQALGRLIELSPNQHLADHEERPHAEETQQC